jgi:hypothetical protein
MSFVMRMQTLDLHEGKLRHAYALAGLAIDFELIFSSFEFSTDHTHPSRVKKEKMGNLP